MGPGCQVVRLATPLKRPEPRAALPAGFSAGFAGVVGTDDEDDDDEVWSDDDD
jgi:hypothetical protein